MLMSNARQTNDGLPSRISTTIFRPGRTDADYLIMFRKINTSISEFEILLVLIHHSHRTARVYVQRIIACRASSGKWMFQIGRGNYRAQHGIHYVAHIWNSNNLSLLVSI